MKKSSKKIQFERLGHYQIIEEIGRGGMAVVYKGLQTSLNRPVAIKVLPEGFAKDKEFIARFDREAETVAHLSHPNIIQIIDRGREEDICYFVMEYVDGLNLDELLKEQTLTFRQVLEIAIAICRALGYAHSKGIVHRDLKPSNVLIGRETLEVKVADFGLVQLAQAAGELSTLTQSNIAMGTIEYMAPEQRRDSRNVDCRADIFSLGIILYEMFTGNLPVGHFKAPSEINTAVPRALDEIILRCLKPDPDDRYQTAGQMAQDLQGLLRGDAGTLNKIVSTVKRAKKRASTAMRNKPKWFIVAGAAGLLVIIAFVLYGLREEEEMEVPPRSSVDSPEPVAQQQPTPPPPQKEPLPAVSAEAEFKKAETYAAGNMKSAKLRDFAIMSMRYVVENYKESAPEWAEKAQLRIGQIYEEAGKEDLALVEYARLLELFSSGALRADSQFRIAECLKPSGLLSGLQKEKRDQAIKAYKKVGAEYPKSPHAPKAFFEMGLLQEAGKTPEDYTVAIASFEVIFREYPESEKAPYAMVKIAEIRQEKKVRDYAGAISIYEEILMRYPDREEEFHVLLNMAKITEVDLGDSEATIEAYRRVIAKKAGTEDALQANHRLEKLLRKKSAQTESK